MSDNTSNRGSLLLSFLYPEGINEIEKVDFQYELKQLIADTVSKKYPNMRYVLADEELIKKEVRETFEKKL